jgi:glucose/arabinose dehydrogenase
MLRASARFFVLFAVVSVIISWPLARNPAQARDFELATVRFLSGVAAPVYLTHAGDDSGRIFIVEQQGRIRIYADGALLTAPFLDITSEVAYGGERGLLSVAFHPNYASNRKFYVYYTREGDYALVISEFEADNEDPNSADDSSERVLLEIPHSQYPNHNGGQLAFGPDGYLYIGTGDGGGGGDPLESGQNLQTLLGKILRIDVNSGNPYGIPPDNPYAGSLAARNEIWAHGMRNPWRFSFDPVTDLLWAADVGQDKWEEVDIIERGGNYGWNTMEGPDCFDPPSGCNQSGLELPIISYDHDAGCSITGGFVYRGTAIAGLQGTYLYGDYCSGMIWGYRDGVVTELLQTSHRIVSFGEDEDGEIYVLAQNGGNIDKLVGSGCTLTCEDVVAVDADANGSEVVTYAPQTVGDCSGVACDPPSGSTFPTGVTPVTCTATGAQCTFDVTVGSVLVTGCEPSSASKKQTLTVVVSGVGFQPGLTISFGEKIKILSTTVNSSTSISVEIKVKKKAQRGPRDITVTNPGGQPVVGSSLFTVT